MTQINPITPREAEEAAITRIPDFVIQIVNDLIKVKYHHGRATIFQEEIIEGIIPAAAMVDEPITESDIFDRFWLDFEEIFERAGWDVKFENPGFDEHWKPHFVFTHKQL